LETHPENSQAGGLAAAAAMFFRSGWRQLRMILGSGLFRRSSVYVVSSAINASANFLMLPVLTRYLTPRDYGIVETLLSAVAVVTVVIVLGSNTIMIKEFFGLGIKDRGIYIGNSLIIIAVMTALISVAGMIMPSPAMAWFHVGRTLLLAAGLVAAARAVFRIALTALQLEKRAGTYAFFVNGNSLLEYAVSLALIVLLGLDWRGRVIGMIAAQLISTLLALSWLQKNGLLVFRPLKYVRHIARLAPALVVGQLASWALSLGDRIMVSHLVNVEGTGLYGVGARFATVITVLGSSFAIAWQPFFFESIGKKEPRTNTRIVQATYLFVVGFLAVSVIYGLGSRWLLHLLVGRHFYSSADFVLLLSLAYCADGIWALFAFYLIHHGRLALYSGILCASAILNVMLDYLLIPRIGSIGAAWSALIALTAGLAATVVAAHRIHPMPWLYFLKAQAGAPLTIA